jgi:hypothetical protein
MVLEAEILGVSHFGADDEGQDHGSEKQSGSDGIHGGSLSMPIRSHTRSRWQPSETSWRQTYRNSHFF